MTTYEIDILLYGMPISAPKVDMPFQLTWYSNDIQQLPWSASKGVKPRHSTWRWHPNGISIRGTI